MAGPDDQEWHNLNKSYMKIRREDIEQEVFDLYDDYAHNRLNRRDFMDKLSAYAIGSITVPALMSFLMPKYESSIWVKKDDPRLRSEYVNYKSEKGGEPSRHCSPNLLT